MIYFDNSATTYPKPERVLKAIQEAPKKYGANPGRSGHTLSINTAVKVYEVREALAKLFGAAQVEDVVFTSNCTHSVNLAFKGVLRQGDHVIISDLEHNAVLRPVHTLAQRGLISYSIARSSISDEETVAAFRRLIRPNTKMIACTHGSNVLGVRLPIREIGRLAQERDILFLVDAAQTAGILPISMPEDHIDFLCMPGHKGLYGPPGTGVLITPLGSVIDTVFEGGTGTLSADYNHPLAMPERLESGTVNTLGIVGLGAGVDYVLDKTLQRIYAHEMKIGAEIYRRLSAIPGIKLYTDTFEMGTHLPVIPFNIGDIPSEEATSRLSDAGFALRGGLHCAPLPHKKMGTLVDGAIRCSIGAFNTTAQGAELCEAVRKIARKATHAPGTPQ